MAALETHHPRLQWIIGLCFGLSMGMVAGLVSILLIRLLCISSAYVQGRRSQGSPIEEDFQADKEMISSQALALLKSKFLVLDRLPVLGVGGVATVYKGTLASGQPVAIKKIPVGNESSSESSSLARHSSWWSTRSGDNLSCSSSGPGKRHALSELGTLGRVRHANLARMYAYCRTPQAHLLAYQLAENGSLQDALSKVRQGRMAIDWATRKNIALGIARGLQYLHCDCFPGIVHRDLKTSNVLLDSKFMAQLSDFGLAREITDDVTHVTVSKIAGTVGYFAPEYANTGKFYMASDVYSMGVVFGALLSGKEPRDDFFTDVEGGMTGWIRYLIQHGQEYRAIDPTMATQPVDVREMKSLLWTAYHCTRPKPSDRPSSKDVVSMLLRTFYPSRYHQMETVPTLIDLL